MSDLTPVPASASSVAAASVDTVESRFGQLAPTSTTSAVALTVVSAPGYLFNTPIIARTTYSTAGIVQITNYFAHASNVTTSVTVNTVVYSTPIVVKNVTQYTNVVPSNTTVWNAQGVASSLLSLPSQSGLASYTEAVVADSEN